MGPISALMGVQGSGVSARSDLLTMRGIGYSDSSRGLARRAI
jgi:hypothetical protein